MCHVLTNALFIGACVVCSQVFLATVGDRDETKLADDLGIRPANLEQVCILIIRHVIGVIFVCQQALVHPQL